MNGIADNDKSNFLPLKLLFAQKKARDRPIITASTAEKKAWEIVNKKMEIIFDISTAKYPELEPSLFPKKTKKSAEISGKRKKITQRSNERAAITNTADKQ